MRAGTAGAEKAHARGARGRRPVVLSGLGLVAALGLGLAACAGRDEPPDILLISIDTLRRDHVSAYGYQRSTTPRIDALAADGALFLNAVSNSNWTLPAHMSLMTGLPASLHRVEDDGSRLDTSLRTLSEVLREAGYATGGITSHFYLRRDYGFSRGFESYDTTQDQKARAVTDKALAWLEHVGQRPFFLFLHYFDPHWGYDPPEPFPSMFGAAYAFYGSSDYLLRHLDPDLPLPRERIPQILRLYDAEIAYTDQQIGRLFDWLGERDRLDATIIVLLSDHGEEFGDHASFGHGTHLHAELMRIPLLVRYPAAVQPGPRTQLVGLSDIPRTLLRLAGRPAPDQFLERSRDLLTHRLAQEGRDERLFVMETTRWGPKRFAVQSVGEKLTTGGSYRPKRFEFRGGRWLPVTMGERRLEPALYDLHSDPLEAVNRLSSARPTQARRKLERALDDFLADSLVSVKLSCRATGDGAEFVARLDLGAALVDEPFSPSSQSDFSVVSLGPRTAQVVLRASGGPISVFFPLDSLPDRVSIRLSRAGEVLFEGEASVGATGEDLPLAPAGAETAACSLGSTRPTIAAQKRSAELGEEDLEQLRSLGYAE